MDEGGLLDQSAELTAARPASEALEAAGAQAADRPARRGRGDRRGDRLPGSERASYVAGAAWSVDGGTVQVII